MKCYMSFVFGLSISVGDWPAFHNSKLICKGQMTMMMVMVIMMMMMMTTMRVGESEREMTFTAL